MSSARLAQARLQAAAGDARGRLAPRSDARRRRRPGDARVGDGEGRDPLHPLVSAADRARPPRSTTPSTTRPAMGNAIAEFSGKELDPGRARRLVVPDGRHPRDLRGARLHRVGSDVAGVHPRQPQRHVPVHPDRLRVVDGRGAGPQDPAAALDGRALQERSEGAEAASATTDGAARSSRRSGPSRSTSSSTSSTTSSAPTSSRRAAPCSAPSRPRARSSTTTTSARSPSACWRS